jgi:D-3-phosphoglycerate dehydrogenase / 2-oxoglutarate reductase
MPEILISTSSFDADDNPALAELRAAGYVIRGNPHGRRLREEEIAALITSDTVGLIAGLEPLTASVLAGAPALQVISRCGIGLDNVDLDAAARHHVAVVNTPDAPVASVAELTLALMLACLRQIPEGDRQIRAGAWPRLEGALLGARIVGIIGCGRIGRRVAELCMAFGTQVIACDPVATLPPTVERVDLDALLARADMVTLHMPALPNAAPLIDATALARLPRGAVVINTARGSLIDPNALARALDDGHVSAAGLDAFEPEPYHGALCGYDQVVLSPHLGSAARETRRHMEHEAATNLAVALQARRGPSPL